MPISVGPGVRDGIILLQGIVGPAWPFWWFGLGLLGAALMASVVWPRPPVDRVEIAGAVVFTLAAFVLGPIGLMSGALGVFFVWIGTIPR